MSAYSYEEKSQSSGGANVRWNAIALAGRQLLILLVSVILARILGPQAYGITAQANVFIVLATLLLDQGLTASLISQKTVTRSMAGAASSVNIGLALVLFIVLWLSAPALADFLNTPELVGVLRVLGAGLVLKALAVVPLMLLSRAGRFRAVATAEVTSALIGGVAGLAAALGGAGYWAIVVQLVVTDLAAAVIFYIAARPPWPNLDFNSLRTSIGFGLRVFFGNLLSFATRNLDNLLVGKVYGATQLGFYALSYRVLLTPVAMIGQTVTRVLFPAISRVQGNRAEISRLLIKSTRGIALASFPFMAFVAISAPQTILLFLGAAWAPAVPVIMVLSVTGARQAVTSTNAPLLLGSGRADIHLKFNIVAAAVQIAGIFAGLPFGILGVALGYTIAGILLTPVIFELQKRLAGTSLTAQLGVMAAPFVCSIVGMVAYWAVTLVALPLILTVVLGFVAFVIAFALVLRVGFSRTWHHGRADVLSLLPGR